MKAKLNVFVVTGLCVGGLFASSAVLAMDADEAQALAKKEGCLKCHAIDKKKEAKSLTDIAKSLKGKPDPTAKLLNHFTSGEKVKFEDGKEEEHKVMKTKDKAAMQNLAEWILSLGK